MIHCGAASAATCIYLLSPRKTTKFFACGGAVWDGPTVGRQRSARIGAIKNDMPTGEHHDRVGFYGFFGVESTIKRWPTHWGTACAWLNSAGLRQTMRGTDYPSATTNAASDANQNNTCKRKTSSR